MVELGVTLFQASPDWIVWLNREGILKGKSRINSQRSFDWLKSQERLLATFKEKPLFTKLTASSLANRVVLFRPDGSLYGLGDNSDGELGISVINHRALPIFPGQRFFDPTVVSARLTYGVLGVKDVALGQSHSIAILEDGALCTWGSNVVGQLGDGRSPDEDRRLIPWKVAGLPAICATAAGSGHSLALACRDRTVWAWGWNKYGQLGDGTLIDRSQPQMVEGLPPINALAVGFSHTLALSNDGKVWSWGENTHWQLGRPTGQLPFARIPAPIQGLPFITKIFATAYLSVAVDKKGKVWLWGEDSGSATPWVPRPLVSTHGIKE